MFQKKKNQEHYVIYDSISFSKTLNLIKSYLQGGLTNKEERKLFLKYILEVIVRDLETSKFVVASNGRWIDTAGFKAPVVSNHEIKDFRYDLLLKIAKLLFKKRK